MHVDEAQDLNVSYALMLMKLCRSFHVDVDMVGDQLQSIWFSKNAMTILMSQHEDKTALVERFSQDSHGFPIIRKQPASNICRRFVDPELRDSVNAAVPFSTFGLPPVFLHDETKHQDCKVKPLECVSFATDTETKSMDSVLKLVQDWIERLFQECTDTDPNSPNRVPRPNDFLFIHPVPGKAHLMARLEEYLNHFWCERLASMPTGERCDAEIDQSKPHAQLHTSDEVQSINLEESKDKSRLVSIHTAKGDGRRFVCVLELCETLLHCFTHGHPSEQLQFESLIHVAITRQKRNLLLVFNILHRDDRVGCRFALSEEERTNTCPHFKFQTTVTTSDLETIMTQTVGEDRRHLLALVDDSVFDPDRAVQDKDQSQNWKHHVIRYTCMHFLWGFYMSLQVQGNSQFVAELYETLNHRKQAVVYKKYSEFKRVLSEVTKQQRTLSNDASSAVDQLVARQNLRKLYTPLLPYPSDPSVPESITNRINTYLLPALRQYKINAIKDALEPLDFVILFYIIDVFDRGLRSGTDPYPSCSNLYEIYDKNFTDADENKAVFHEATEVLKHSFEDYCTHYAPALGGDAKTCGLLCYQKNFKTKPSKQFDMKMQQPRVVYGANEVHLHYLFPEHSDINRAQHKFRMLAERYFLEHLCHDEKILQRDDSTNTKKTVRSFFFTLTHTQCFEVKMNTLPLLAGNHWLVRNYLESIRINHQTLLWRAVEHFQQKEVDTATFDLIDTMHPETYQKYAAKRFRNTLIGAWVTVLVT